MIDIEKKSHISGHQQRVNELIAQTPLQSSRRQAALESYIERLRDEIATDAGTGLKSRRWFDKQLKEKITRANEHRHELTYVAIDIDDLRLHNEIDFHPVVNLVFEKFRNIFTIESNGNSRWEASEVARLTTGDELGLVISGQIQDEELAHLVDGFRKKLDVESKNILGNNLPLPYTLSIGVAKYIPGESATDLMKRADHALYECKQGKGGDHRPVIVDHKGDTQKLPALVA
jgi:diguanylate cyclase